MSKLAGTNLVNLHGASNDLRFAGLRSSSFQDYLLSIKTTNNTGTSTTFSHVRGKRVCSCCLFGREREREFGSSPMVIVMLKLSFCITSFFLSASSSLWKKEYEEKTTLPSWAFSLLVLRFLVSLSLGCCVEASTNEIFGGFSAS